jgi:aminoglycoside phosphotransferase (APT) family kinase protein
VRAEIARWLSDVSGDDTTATIVDVRAPDAAGSSHSVTFVTAQFDAHGRSVVRDLVLRRDPDELALFVDADLGRETELMQRVHRLATLPVPEVIGFNPDATVLGTPYMVIAKVPGAVASDNPSYNSSGWLADAAPTRRRAIWQQALRVMSQVTTIDAGAFDDLFPDRLGLHAELAYWHRNLLWAADGSPSPTIDAAWQQLSTSVPPDSPAALSWGDARIGNIVFDAGTPAAIIDWEMASLGGAHLDIGWWLMTDLVHSTQMGCTRLDGLGTRSETIEAWCAATGLDADTIEWHEAFAALKLGVTIGRVTNVAHRRGRMPAELLSMADDNFGTRILAQLLPVPPPRRGG